MQLRLPVQTLEDRSAQTLLAFRVPITHRAAARARMRLLSTPRMLLYSLLKALEKLLAELAMK